jgi:ADP-heptose:LPS heptosyltransferase
VSVLVLRFSSLGDVVLAAGVTAALGDVVFGTSAALAPVVARFEGVRAVVALTPGESPWAFARRLPAVDRVIDLQGSIRSRLICGLVNQSTSRVTKHTVRRHLRVMMKVAPPPQSVVERYAAAAGVRVGPTPWLTRSPTTPDGALALAPGAAHATKRWPESRWISLARQARGPIVLLGGEVEAPLLARIAEGAGRADLTQLAERGFERTLRALEGCRALVANDSGLLHLAGALGLPVVGLFGPTTPEDGFWAWSGQGRAVGVDLPCRPCARFGGPRCPIGDHACMEALGVEGVVAALGEIQR